MAGIERMAIKPLIRKNKKITSQNMPEIHSIL